MEIRFFLLLSLASLITGIWGNPIRFSPFDLFEEIGETSMQARSRSKRSCSNAFHTLLLSACNKNHKRSPIIMSMIYLEYYLPSDPNSDAIAGTSEAALNGNLQRQLDKNLESSMMITTNSFFEALLGAYLQKMDEEFIEHFGRDVSKSPETAQHRIQSFPGKRAKRSPSPLHSAFEKCCSPAGCSDMDFLNFCF